MATAVPPGKSADRELIVVGGGVIGLSIALRAANRGLTIQVFDAGLPGTASRVAAGLLAPSLGSLPPTATAAFRAAARGYDDFLASIVGSGPGPAVAVGKGILEIALPPQDASSLNEQGHRDAQTMSPQTVAGLAPELAPVSGAVLHGNDGWVEPAALLNTLVSRLPAGTLTPGRVAAIERGSANLTVRLDSGVTYRARQVVIAAGSWSPMIDGLSTRLPIVPARGEVLVIETSHSLSYAVASEDGYLVPRPGAIVVGSTFDFVGYDARTTSQGRSRLEAFAARVIPGPFSRATHTSQWAGLRPMTPDSLPIIDRDPGDDRIILACGHGRNGLLLAGFTTDIVLDLLAGNRLEPNSPFRLDRFQVE